jgi:hypothetical protein
LHLRRIADRTGKPARRISELMDSKTKSLAQETQTNDVILSNEIIGMALTQLATEHDRSDIFRELLDPKGARISMKASSRYAMPGEKISFASLVYLSQSYQEIAIGIYKTDAKPGERVQLNPSKDEVVEIGDSCKIIIMEGNVDADDSPVHAQSPEAMQGF